MPDISKLNENVCLDSTEHTYTVISNNIARTEHIHTVTNNTATRTENIYSVINNTIARTEHTGCPEKNAPQFLLNFSGCKHARRMGHNSLERWDP